jgi:ATP-dependent exoDNAse (exonuclease V) alpha subunit
VPGNASCRIRTKKARLYRAQPTHRTEQKIRLSLQCCRQGYADREHHDKDVYNSDIGSVTHIDLDERELTATFDEHIVTYAFGELDELVLCYAATIHKSKG